LPKHQLGTEATELLIQRINGVESKPVLKKIPTELRIRESCGFAQYVGRTHQGDQNGAVLAPVTPAE